MDNIIVQNYNQNISVNSTIDKAFNALTKEMEKWWGIVSSPISKIGDEFKINFGKDFWIFRVTEFIENEKLVLECIDGQPESNREWIGTTLNWKIESEEGEVKIELIHDGLIPEFNCYDVCSSTWDKLITQSLKNYLETGKGMPLIF